MTIELETFSMTNTCHWTSPWTCSIYVWSLQPLSLRPILILCSLILLRLPSVIFQEMCPVWSDLNCLWYKIICVMSIVNLHPLYWCLSCHLVICLYFLTLLPSSIPVICLVHRHTSHLPLFQAHISYPHLHSNFY